MTQKEIVQEFKTYTVIEQADLLDKLFRVMRESLENEITDKQLSQAERTAAIESLRGIAEMENPPLTKEETREDYYSYLAEKYS